MRRRWRRCWQDLQAARPAARADAGGHALSQRGERPTGRELWAWNWSARCRAPSRSERPDDLTIDDFVIDEKTEQVTCCPDGQTPVRSVHHPASGRTRTTMPAAVCSRCAYRHQCPVEEGPEGYHLEHTAKQRRVAGRRREQQTEVFRERYRRRNGIESTNSGLKRRTGLGHLRVRGRPRVFQAIYLKIAGWNILRASICAKMRNWCKPRPKPPFFGSRPGSGRPRTPAARPWRVCKQPLRLSTVRFLIAWASREPREADFCRGRQTKPIVAKVTWTASAL